ncbi:Crp/Fnr family transcriptional regulator [endosymbiont of unidentified scaly snail isolate Monju]|uniref:Crp/Fnr family transcriptional regulator n=1 Tax=endosymbiont of unidentified scaly snail isolate Monju TaxID=1248727 RepID=UPI0003892C1D|nr:Crp/Fnr family transcriptional regulator [endosymbiont of unidentified scaly snail isolate Monju]BAN68828.1 CRP/FNR family transcriptional regulator, anaerobic regulatory protein [endosymbiont of unidentified scaly snail isolate Monju]
MAKPSGNARSLLIRQRYPMLDDPELVAAIDQAGLDARLPAGAAICDLGQECTHLALVLEGRARVYELAESGREITLYRIEAGECCILTASCILGGERFPAIASCERDLQVILIPAVHVEDFMLRFPAWRRFIWRLLATRLSGVLMLLEEVTFRRLDQRLLRYLLQRGEESGRDDLAITHQTIADDLGTSREVVSRVLKDLAHRGMLELRRGHVQLHRQALKQALAQCD